jgi:hypothetical protein
VGHHILHRLDIKANKKSVSSSKSRCFCLYLSTLTNCKGVGKYSKDFHIIAPPSGKLFLVYDRKGKRMFALGPTSGDICKIDMLCGAISPDSQLLYYVRMMEKKKPKKCVLVVYKRALLNGVIGKEDGPVSELDLNCEKHNTHVWLASHELEDCSVLIVVTSHGQRQIIPITPVRHLSLASG